MTAPQDDPWAVLDGRLDPATRTTWLARLVALEDQEHDADCCDPEDAP